MPSEDPQDPKKMPAYRAPPRGTVTGLDEEGRPIESVPGSPGVHRIDEKAPPVEIEPAPEPPDLLE